jgi:hypothetical protein
MFWNRALVPFKQIFVSSRSSASMLRFIISYRRPIKRIRASIIRINRGITCQIPIIDKVSRRTELTGLRNVSYPFGRYGDKKCSVNPLAKWACSLAVTQHGMMYGRVAIFCILESPNALIVSRFAGGRRIPFPVPEAFRFCVAHIVGRSLLCDGSGRGDTE